MWLLLAATGLDGVWILCLVHSVRDWIAGAYRSSATGSLGNVNEYKKKKKKKKKTLLYAQLKHSARICAMAVIYFMRESVCSHWCGARSQHNPTVRSMADLSRTASTRPGTSTSSSAMTGTSARSMDPIPGAWCALRAHLVELYCVD